VIINTQVGRSRVEKAYEKYKNALSEIDTISWDSLFFLTDFYNSGLKRPFSEKISKNDFRPGKLNLRDISMEISNLLTHFFVTSF